mmetsp:Transcript_27581/g.85486  ORF Transcript_27581/g.85486 Transcript_27581/m.85486 type:complete len:203 (+) Transcript_27581:367-975(+)
MGAPDADHQHRAVVGGGSGRVRVIVCGVVGVEVARLSSGTPAVKRGAPRQEHRVRHPESSLRVLARSLNPDARGELPDDAARDLPRHDGREPLKEHGARLEPPRGAPVRQQVVREVRAGAVPHRGDEHAVQSDADGGGIHLVQDARPPIALRAREGGPCEGETVRGRDDDEGEEERDARGEGDDVNVRDEERQPRLVQLRRV